MHARRIIDTEEIADELQPRRVFAEIPPWLDDYIRESLRYFTAPATANDDVDVPVILCGAMPELWAS